MTNTYNTNIAEAIRVFMDEGWNYDFNQEEGLFRFSVSLHTKMNSVDYTIYVKKDGFLTRVAAPLGADMEDLPMARRLVEFLSRINDGLMRGSFGLDWNDGEIAFLFYTDCEGINEPGEGMIENALLVPAMMFDQFGNGIIEVLLDERVNVQEVADKYRMNRRHKPEEEEAISSSPPETLDDLLAELEAHLQKIKDEEVDEESNDSAEER